MKRFYLLILSLIFILPIVAQNGKAKVAIFDPMIVGSKKVDDEITKTAVREMISSTIVNSGMYSIVERLLLDNVMKELEFSNSGAVDESQASEIGKMAGANKVIVSVIIPQENAQLFSVKIIDTQSATVERQKMKRVEKQDLINSVEAITRELIGDNSASQTITTQPHRSSLAVNTNKIRRKGTYLYKDNKKLSMDEMETLTIHHPEMFNQYKKARTLKKWTWGLMGTGLGLMTMGAVMLTYSYDSELLFGFGIFSLVSGFSCEIACISTDAVARKKVKRIANEYNRQQQQALSYRWDIVVPSTGGLGVRFSF